MYLEKERKLIVSTKKRACVPVQEKVEILSNEKIAKSCYKLILKAPLPFLEAIPGQFIHIRIGDSFSPLLRRPFSISKVTEEGISIIYKVVGRGTKILSEMKKGNYLDILGPLGRGFVIKEEIKKYLLVGGGMGVAPLVFLLQRITQEAKEEVSTSVFLGFKTAEMVILENEFVGKNITLDIATEDGSRGHKGLVSGLIQKYVENLPCPEDVGLYACGPIPMLKTIAKLSLARNISSQVGLEEMIGCGVGACRGCVVKGTRGYLRVCQEGPVFNVEEILWDNVFNVEEILWDNLTS